MSECYPNENLNTHLASIMPSGFPLNDSKSYERF